MALFTFKSSLLQEQKIDGNRLVLYGESLGTGVATKLATQHPFCPN